MTNQNYGVIGGGNGAKDRNRHDLTNVDNYEEDYALPFGDRVKSIYEIPSTGDMADVFVRSVFRNERQAIAFSRLAYRHIKFSDKDHQEQLRVRLASLPAIGGVRSLEALFAATNLIAPDMYRVARGMPKSKKDEPVHRGSDFRSHEVEKKDSQ